MVQFHQLESWNFNGFRLFSCSKTDLRRPFSDLQNSTHRSRKNSKFPASERFEIGALAYRTYLLRRDRHLFDLFEIYPLKPAWITLKPTKNIHLNKYFFAKISQKQRHTWQGLSDHTRGEILFSRQKTHNCCIPGFHINWNQKENKEVHHVQA